MPFARESFFSCDVTGLRAERFGLALATGLSSVSSAAAGCTTSPGGKDSMKSMSMGRVSGTNSAVAASSVAKSFQDALLGCAGEQVGCYTCCGSTESRKMT